MSTPIDASVLHDVPRLWAARRPAAAALTCEDRVTTWDDLARATERMAAALAAAGVRPGTRVAWLGKDSERAYEVVFGCARAGAVLMGLNWRLTPSELQFILADGRAEVCFVDALGTSLVAPIREALPDLRVVVEVDAGGAETGAASGTETVDYAAFLAAAPGPAPAHAASPEDVVVQMYTSGTTGRPKGVMLAHRSFFAVVRSMRAAGDGWIGFDEHDVSLCALPTFHIGGLWWAITGLAAGATNVLVPAFTAGAVLELVPRHGVTKTCLVPAMMQVVLAEPGCEAAAFATLDCIVYGGSPIPRTLLERALDVFGCRFAQIYGLTETGNTAVCLRPEDHADLASERLLAAGRPYPCVRLKVIDAEGRELPPRAVGEICIRSDANMVGYANRPEATAETLRDGWVHTGDAGFLDEDGYVFIRDRVKDMVIYAGENVYPAEIESVLCAHPAVAEAAVIGVPDERWGELVKAIVVKRPGADVRARELIAWCRHDLADFKVPKSVDFVDALPRTPSGKIQKAKLRAPYWEGRERQV
ncbi:MAG: long-chain-fatty-acid--CoA ligase [Planctomycetes bacterium]|nr:long-chain-fatty-acid--CoA ligase [Planctomycetota bacterium]